ncbi:hypothetical protein AB0G54_03740 [Streptomyces yokosukanensis]|uniref:hypothetical protein n=1 Tax=Streptomyces yokosukanensis TaxID=67386 RepID=UPI0034429477
MTSNTRVMVIGRIARDFDLRTRTTGGRRIGMSGTRVEQLPLIRTRSVDACGVRPRTGLAERSGPAEQAGPPLRLLTHDGGS